MIYTTFVARASDGLLLSESYEDKFAILFEATSKVKEFLQSKKVGKENFDLKLMEVSNYNLL